MGFFSELHDDLVQVEKKIAKVDESMLSEQEREQYELITAVASLMIDNPELWEKKCLYNIQYIGNGFKSRIQNLQDNISELEAAHIYECMVRFLVELDLSYGLEGLNFLKSDSFGKVIIPLKDKMYFPRSEYAGQLNYAFYKMPIDILCSYMGNKGFKTFFEFDERRNALEKSIQKYQNEVNEKIVEVQQRINDVDKLKEKLDEYKTAFTFVGLNKGFENLLRQKNEAKTKTFRLLSGLAIVTILPLGFSFYEKFMAGVDILWQSMLPVIGLEFILIYFFRVVLTHYHSIQTQIMQLELRQSLCEFIQSYAEYAKKIKTNDKDALEKFENLIFSSILSNPDKVPGTFDGVEGLTSLLKELKK
ncbi:hypothetical protein [Neisseria mucosa]|uniref:hypothetical protein n=1 Tax=Neisseria mucosa TaxID=488 RepID=UPI00280B566E|nr:hypothetical protein [Neisseria mucosa]